MPLTPPPARLARARTAAAITAVLLLGVTACDAGSSAIAADPLRPTVAAPTAPDTPSATAAVSPGGVSPPVSPGGVSLPGATRPGSAPPVVRHGPRDTGMVALTFDADMTTGMWAKLDSGQAHSYANLKIVDFLERREVPATFFLTGMWVRRYPDVTRRLAANPRFELANHSWSHRGFTPNCYTLGTVPRAEMAAELNRTFDIIAPFGGHQTRYFRFPGGCANATALTALSPLGVTVVQWDVVSGDPKATAWRPIVRAVLDHVRPGSIVVLHITEDNAPMTDEALPSIVDGLRRKGLRPVTLSTLLGGD